MLAVLLILIAIALVLVAHSLLHPPRMSDGKAAYVLKRLSPGDLGMRFSEMTFTVHNHRAGSALDIASWWIPHSASGDRTVVFVHGYADAKVGSIAWAPTWQQLGFHVLAIDLRAHGESGGFYTTGGVLERRDLDQVLNQLRAIRPEQPRRLVLFGISFGAAVVLAAAEGRDDLAAVVLECPFARYRNAVRTHVRIFDLPLPSLLPAVMWIGKRLSGVDLDEIQPLQLLSRVKCPLMVIQSGDDPFVPPEDAREIESALMRRPPKCGLAVYRHVPGASHLLALTIDPADYARRLGEFLRA